MDDKLFDREITVYVTGNTAGELSFWTREFKSLFGGSTTVSADGTWGGETERVNLVSHLYDRRMPDWSHYELNNLVYNYKREAKQDAVLVVDREVKGRLY